MRVLSPAGERGSLKWLQIAVNRAPDTLALPALNKTINWVSPLADDEFAEYRDSSFLARLGLSHLNQDLAAFWPSRGPQWDALGIAGQSVVLVEAKAHLNEFFSPPCAAGDTTRPKIEAALRTAKIALGVEPATDWTTRFYQYTNRLAHLNFLRCQGVDAHLVFVSFLHDVDMGGPSSAAEWDAAFRTADHVLGLGKRHALSPYIHHVHPDVRPLMQLKL